MGSPVVACHASRFWMSTNGQNGNCKRNAPRPTERADEITSWAETFRNDMCGQGVERSDVAQSILNVKIAHSGPNPLAKTGSIRWTGWAPAPNGGVPPGTASVTRPIPPPRQANGVFGASRTAPIVVPKASRVLWLSSDNVLRYCCEMSSQRCHFRTTL